MKDLIFSINIVAPVFLLILFGWVLKRKGIITEEFNATATTIVYYFALPARLFLDVSGSDFYSLMDGTFILFIVAATLISFIAIWIPSALFVKDRRKISALVHGAFRGNYVYVGLPITQNILGVKIVPSSILVIAFVLPLYNILSVILLSYYSGQKDRLRVSSLLLSILKNPMIIAIAAALPFSLLQVELPFACTKSLDYLGILASPLALLLVGASIRFDAFFRNFRYILSASFFKVILQPLVFVPVAILLGFSAEKIVTVFIMLAAPTALNSYIMTRKLGGDAELGAGIIVMTVLISIIIIPAGTFLLKLTGIL